MGFSQQMQIPIIDLLLSEDIGVLDKIEALQYRLQPVRPVQCLEPREMVAASAPAPLHSASAWCRLEMFFARPASSIRMRSAQSCKKLCLLGCLRLDCSEGKDPRGI